MDAHAEHEIGSLRCGCNLLHGGLRVKRHPHAETKAPCLGDGLGRLADGLDVERDAVATCRLDLVEMSMWLGDHEVAVDDALAAVDEVRDGLDHDRPDRDLVDEM